MAVRRAAEDKPEVVKMDTAAVEASASRRDPEQLEEPAEVVLVVQSVEEEQEVAWEDAMDDPTMDRTVPRPDRCHLSTKV